MNARPLPRRSATTFAIGATITAALTLASCSGSPAPSPSTSGPSSTATPTASTAAPSSVAPVSEAPIAPAVAPSEVAAPNNACPYITNDAAREAEGDRVGRVTLITTDPVGCNFFFQYDPGRLILQISVENYPSEVGAYNAMVRTAEASSEQLGVPDLVPGVDAVLYRTTFYPPDGDRDWACAFAKDNHVVTVKTQQNDVSFNAKNAATQIASKF